jgi:hypothetical protein
MNPDGIEYLSGLRNCYHISKMKLASLRTSVPTTLSVQNEDPDIGMNS